MSLERQFLDHILSPRLAHHPTDSAVGQPLIGATWVDEYPRVCQWHARTRRRLTCGDRGHPRLDWATPPLPITCIYTHAYTLARTSAGPLALSSCPLETTPCSRYWVSGHYLCQRGGLVRTDVGRARVYVCTCMCTSSVCLENQYSDCNFDRGTALKSLS